MWGSHLLGHLRLGFCPCSSARGPRRQRHVRRAISAMPCPECHRPRRRLRLHRRMEVHAWRGHSCWRPCLLFFSREPLAGVVAVQPEARDCQESSLSSSCVASARNRARLVPVCWCGAKAGQILVDVNWGFHTRAEVRRDGTRWKNVSRASIPECRHTTLIWISLERRATRPYFIPPRCHIPHPHLSVPQRSTRLP